MLSAYWPDPHVPPEQRGRGSRARSTRFNTWFDRQAERLQDGDRLGARSPLGDGRRSRCCRSSARSRCRRSASSAAAFFPVTDDSEFNITLETPPGSNLAVHAAEGRGSGAAGARAAGGGLHLHDDRRHDRRGRRGHRLRAPDAEARRATAARRWSSRSCAQELSRLGGVTASITTSGFGDLKQIQLQLVGPDTRELQQLADRVLGARQGSARRRRRRALDAAARSRSSTCSSTARSPARSA